MLSKLIKYDIRSTWREFAGVYLCILLGVMIIPPLFNHFNNEIVSAIAGFAAVGIVITTIVIMIMTLFTIFNTNVFSKQGYLTMTLPVTSTQLVVSKLLVSTMWIILTGIVSALGILIFVLNLNAAPLAEITAGVQKVLSMLDNRSVLVIVMVILAMIVSSVKEISKLFLACSIAHLKQLNRFRVPVGIFSYFVFSWLESLVVQAVAFLASMLPFAQKFAHQIELMNDPTSIQQFSGLFSGIMAVGILYASVLTVLYSIGTIGILNRKLDLD